MNNNLNHESYIMYEKRPFWWSNVKLFVSFCYIPRRILSETAIYMENLYILHKENVLGT